MGLVVGLKLYVLQKLLRENEEFEEFTLRALDRVVDAETVVFNRWFLAAIGVVALVLIGKGVLLFFALLFAVYLAVQAIGLSVSSLPFLLMGALGVALAVAASLGVVYLLYRARIHATSDLSAEEGVPEGTVAVEEVTPEGTVQADEDGTATVGIRDLDGERNGEVQEQFQRDGRTQR
jgi:membrane protein implicated in regulation of membrane protease activity